MKPRLRRFARWLFVPKAARSEDKYRGEAFANGLELVVPTVLLTLLGLWADSSWGTAPLFLIIGFVFGAVGTYAEPVLQVPRPQRDQRRGQAVGALDVRLGLVVDLAATAVVVVLVRVRPARAEHEPDDQEQRRGAQLLSAHRPSNVKTTVGTTSSRPLAKASPRYLSSLRAALGTNSQRTNRRSRGFTGDFLPRVDASLRATPACEYKHKLVGASANRQTGGPS